MLSLSIAIVKEKVSNLAKKLREDLGMNQVDFARAIGRSYASVRNYEAGHKIPDEVADSMRALAAKHGLRFAYINNDAPVDPIRMQRKPSGQVESEHQRWHQMLDRVLNSSNRDAIEAVKKNLIVFTRYVEKKK